MNLVTSIKDESVLEGGGLRWPFYSVNRCTEMSPKELFLVPDLLNKLKNGWAELSVTGD